MAEVQSPEWWRDRLVSELSARSGTYTRLKDYYEGRHPLAFTTTKYRAEFAAMLAGIADNWMALVVDAAEERLHVDGFRIGDGESGDQDAWAIWQRNQLDSDSELGHSAAILHGRAAVLVWADEDGEPEITVEDPSQMIVAYEPGSRRRRAAAVKQWRDDWTGATNATLYLPDKIQKWSQGKRGWEDREDPLPNPLGLVPVVELVNRPRLLGDGRSEIADVTSTQDQINKLLCDMLVASEFGAFRQRWATGIEIATDPDTGESLEPFKAAIDRLWTAAPPDVRFGEFAQTDLGGYIRAVENRVQSLASRTRTPPHYLLGQSGSFPSGESLKATETGLIAKVRSKQRHFGERWEEVIRLAFAVTGDPRAGAWDAETIWADPESRSESEHVDALLKKMALGVPPQQLWEDAGYTPQQIARFKSMLVDQALIDALAQPVEPASAGA